MRPLARGLAHSLYNTPASRKAFEKELLLTAGYFLMDSNGARPPMERRVGSLGAMYKLGRYHVIMTAGFFDNMPFDDETKKFGFRATEISDHFDDYLAREIAIFSGWIPALVHGSFEKLKENRYSHLITTPGGLLQAGTFTTQSYAGGSHTDKDATNTGGRCTHRGKHLQDREQNFFLFRFSLILPLRAGARWAWRAAMDEHGTTLARFQVGIESKEGGDDATDADFIQRTAAVVVSNARFNIALACNERFEGRSKTPADHLHKFKWPKPDQQQPPKKRQKKM